MGWCLTFATFLLLTGQSCFSAVQRADLQKLSRGIDHRSRICGWSDGTADLTLLHWCSARTEHGLVLNWSSPICVEQCPQRGTSVFCPEGLEVTEEELREGGRRLLVRTEKQMLAPLKVNLDTKPWMERYCVPAADQPFEIWRRWTTSGAVAQALVVLEQLLSLASMPRLLLLATLWTLALSVAYLRCLRQFALFFVHAAMLTTVILCLAGGLGFLAVSKPALLAGYPAALESVHALGAWIPAAVATGISALFFVAAVCLIGCLCARRRLDVASDCIRESCAVMLAMPSLLLLPVLDSLCYLLLSAALLVSLPLMLSTTEVSSVTVLGITGVFRQFHLSVADYGRLTALVFSCFWVQEVIGAACTLATAYSVALWYFAPGTCGRAKAKHLPWAPALQGLVVAFLWHLGSLAKGASALALLRLLRWLLYLAHAAAAEDDAQDAKRKRRRCCQCFAVFCDALLATLQAWTEFLSAHAYVDIALSSQSFSAAAREASEILGSHMALVSILSLVSWFLRLVGSSILAVIAGSTAWFVAARREWLMPAAMEIHRQLEVSGFPTLQEQLMLLLTELQAVSPEVLGLLTAGLMLLVNQAVLVTVECTACTVLYCLLWDGSDGVLDASHVPESFWRFAKDQGIVGRRAGKALQQKPSP
ncbi:unnamed protein product [Cladocopium goreaui]|uniref:Choline transporter-like protein n=1 Tax=Cladocopium goreaui TaxID=2562237 RepID=A0A9P1G6Q3_9DINO|nr:unnamed protein product [Cladocopium goreaui]